jgi:hypothetical protein
MRRSYVFPMRWMVIYGYELSGGALNLSSSKLLSPWSQLKNLMIKPGMEPGTSWSVVRNTDHWTTRLVGIQQDIEHNSNISDTK